MSVPAVLVGHSYGGMVITEASGHHPFLSQPEALSHVIASAAGIVGGRV
ncbi:hypothetical protein [Saccharothrix deserti]|nr:hypothetical protein [Saccharothrix deserti]